MPEIQIKMSKKDESDLRCLLISFRKNRAGQKEFEDFINNLIYNTFDMSMKICRLVENN